METDKEHKYLRAKEKVDNIKKFYTGLMNYTVVIVFLGGINYWLNQWAYPWFLWAAFGWGIGLIFQAIKAFEIAPFLGKNWEEKKIKELMGKEREQRWK